MEATLQSVLGLYSADDLMYYINEFNENTCQTISTILRANHVSFVIVNSLWPGQKANHRPRVY
jgi:hypothetical protein